MSTYYMQQKQQETAVRKVFGATRREMLRRLVGNFMAQVAVAFLIAVPVAWYALDRWLQDYSVRIRLGAWIFLAAGAFAAIVALATVFWQSSRAAAANPVTHSKTDPLGDTVHPKTNHNQSNHSVMLKIENLRKVFRTDESKPSRSTTYRSQSKKASSSPSWGLRDAANRRS